MSRPRRAGLTQQVESGEARAGHWSHGRTFITNIRREPRLATTVVRIACASVLWGLEQGQCVTRFWEGMLVQMAAGGLLVLRAGRRRGGDLIACGDLIPLMMLEGIKYKYIQGNRAQHRGQREGGLE